MDWQTDRLIGNIQTGWTFTFKTGGTYPRMQPQASAVPHVHIIFLAVCSLTSTSRYFIARGYAVIFLHRESSLKPFQRHFSQENFLDWLKSEANNSLTGTFLITGNPSSILHVIMGMGHNVLFSCSLHSRRDEEQTLESSVSIQQGIIELLLVHVCNTQWTSSWPDQD